MKAHIPLFRALVATQNSTSIQYIATPTRVPDGGWRTAALVLTLALTAFPGPALAEARSVNDCQKLVDERPDDLESYRCFWMVARCSGDWQASEQALREMLTEAPEDPRIQLFLGSVLADQGKPEGRDYFEQAAAGFSMAGNASGECAALTSLIAELNRRKKPDEAWTFLQRARTVAAATGDAELITQVGLCEGWYHIAKEEYDEASEILRLIEAELSPQSPYALRYRTLEAQAFVTWATGRYRTSFELYRRCLNLAREQQEVQDAAAAAYNTLLVAARLQPDEDSIEHLQCVYAEALDAAVKSGNAALEANARMSLGQPFDGDPQRRQQVVAALEAARRAEDPVMEMAALRGLAQHDSRSGPSRWQAARNRAQEALVLARSTDYHDGIIRGYLVLGSVLEVTQQRPEAFVARHRALDEIEQLHQMQITQETSARIASRWSFAYYDLIGHLLYVSDGISPDDTSTVKALTVMERLRGHSRSELFTQAGATGVDLPSPGLALSLERIRKALAPGETLLSYQLSTQEKGGAWVILIGSQQVAAITLPDRSTIDPVIEAVLSLVQQDEPNVADALGQLAALVLDPVLDTLPPQTSRLVIVPDGKLFSVPFAAIRPRGSGYLAETYTIEIVPSLLAWLAWREQPAPAVAPAVLGFADPAVATVGGEEDTGEGSLDQTRTFPELPYSRREIKAVCALVGNGSTWVWGDGATDKPLRGAADRASPILHFATHAVVDSDNPKNTAVLLAPCDAADDGRLTILDILGIRHGARLVILNSCRSASGVVLQGRGVLGLTQSFLASGARAVVGNLWSVGDRSAEHLVTSFYQALVRGAPVADALVLAQRQQIADNEPPAVWASLTAQGDGRLEFVPVAPSRLPAGILLAAVLFGLAILVVAGVRR